jgi:hypothetical protein|tara:strand:+ start:1034 stop:1477 length:444 start_codon:yes stop_codon:yes gene_type:complete
MAESNKSKYYPSYPNKYKGDSTNIICRSTWERKFCRWCDLNESILEWGSEEFYIPYISPLDNRVHRYFPDFIIKVKESTGQIKTYVIEVKPKKQTRPPKTPKRKTKSYLYECKTYAVNQAKWKAAVEFCEDRRIKFKIITEDELGIK